MNICIAWFYISMESCQKGPTRHAYAGQIGPFWQDTLDFTVTYLKPCLCSYTPQKTIGYAHISLSQYQIK